jgi:hypothetical protein
VKKKVRTGFEGLKVYKYKSNWCVFVLYFQSKNVAMSSDATTTNEEFGQNFVLNPRQGALNALAVEKIKQDEGVEELIDNSFSAGTTTTTLRFASKGGRHEIIVADDGVGMNQSELVKMLQLNIQGNNHKQNNVNIFGRGIWVAIVSLLNRDDPQDYVEITTTKKGSNEVLRCIVNLHEFYHENDNTAHSVGQKFEILNPKNPSNVIYMKCVSTLLRECSDIGEDLFPGGNFSINSSSSSSSSSSNSSSSSSSSNSSSSSSATADTVEIGRAHV